MNTSADTIESFEKNICFSITFSRANAATVRPLMGYEGTGGEVGNGAALLYQMEMILTPVGVKEVKEEERHDKRHFEFAEEGEI